MYERRLYARIYMFLSVLYFRPNCLSNIDMTGILQMLLRRYVSNLMRSSSAFLRNSCEWASKYMRTETMSLYANKTHS